MNEDSRPAAPTPKPVLFSGAVTGALGLIAVVFAIAVAVAAAMGRSFPGLSSPATAIAFLAFGGLLVAAGWSLYRGKLWGRGVVIIVCLILLPIAYGVVKDSRQPWFGYPLGLAALLDLACLFTPSALRWTSENRTF